MKNSETITFSKKELELIMGVYSEALSSLENQTVTITNGMFFISGSLIKENNTFYLFVTEQVGRSFANIGFTIEDIESINVNEEVFGKSALEHDKYTIVLKG